MPGNQQNLGREGRGGTPLFEIFSEDNCTFSKYLRDPGTSAVPFSNQPHTIKTSLWQGSVYPRVLHSMGTIIDISGYLTCLECLLEYSSTVLPASCLRRKPAAVIVYGAGTVFRYHTGSPGSGWLDCKVVIVVKNMTPA